MSTVNQAVGFIEFDEISGEPYFGIEYTTAGVSVRLYLCNKATAQSFKTGVTQGIDQLMATKPKLVAAKGTVN